MLAAPIRRSLCSADDELAAHEFFVVEDFHCALRFFHRCERHEAKALGFLGVAVGHDLRGLHGADAVEEFPEVSFSRVERQISDIDFRRCHFYGFRLASRARGGGCGCSCGCVCRRIRAGGDSSARRGATLRTAGTVARCLFRSEKGHDLLPKALLFGSFGRCVAGLAIIASLAVVPALPIISAGATSGPTPRGPCVLRTHLGWFRCVMRPADVWAAPSWRRSRQYFTANSKKRRCSPEQVESAWRQQIRGGFAGLVSGI